MLLALTAAFPSALQNVSADLVRLFARMPAPARYLLVGFAQLTILFIPAIIVWWVASRRSARTAGLVVGAAVAGAISLLLAAFRACLSLVVGAVTAAPGDYSLARRSTSG